MYHPVINLASAKSAWRGLGIYRASKVLTCEKARGTGLKGLCRARLSSVPRQTVLGPSAQLHVRLPAREEPSSHLQAQGRAFLQSRSQCREGLLREVELEELLYNAALKREAEERHREIVSYVSKLTKAQLQQELINALEELDSRDQYSRW